MHTSCICPRKRMYSRRSSYYLPEDFHILWPKRLRAESTHPENWPKRPTYQGRNDPPPNWPKRPRPKRLRPKRPRAETTRFPNRWPLSYLNLTKNMKTYIRPQQHTNFKHQDIKRKNHHRSIALERSVI